MGELVDLVDDKNNVIGTIEREEAIARDLPIRVVHVFVMNSQKQLYLARRSASMSWYPSHWGSSAAGFVKAGESYAYAATREREEELGIKKDVPLLSEGPIVLRFDGQTRFAHCFSCVYNGKIVLDPREFAEGRFFSREEAEQWMMTEKIVPSLPILYDRFMH